MAFLGGLVFFYYLLWLVSFFAFTNILSQSDMRGTIATTIMFFVVGLAHFIAPKKLEAMIPPKLPYKPFLNYLTGGCEMLFAIGVLLPRAYLISGWGLIILLILMFPANVYVAVKNASFYNISRLFFQPVYIAWVWWFCLN